MKDLTEKRYKELCEGYIIGITVELNLNKDEVRMVEGKGSWVLYTGEITTDEIGGKVSFTFNSIKDLNFYLRGYFEAIRRVKYRLFDVDI